MAPELEPNLIALFERAAARAAANPFLWTKIDGVYRSSSWDLVARQARLIARTLQAHGIEPGERVMLVGENRPEWLAADLAIMTAGAVSVPAYTTNSVDDHHYLLTHSEASAAIVSTDKLAANLLPALAQVSGIKVLLSFEALTDCAGLPFPVIARTRRWPRANRRPNFGSTPRRP